MLFGSLFHQLELFGPLRMGVELLQVCVLFASHEVLGCHESLLLGQEDLQNVVENEEDKEDGEDDVVVKQAL